MLKSVFEAFKLQKENEKIYVIIDEYDHFANELLGFNTDKFKILVSKNGRIRKWYEVLKQEVQISIEDDYTEIATEIALEGKIDKKYRRIKKIYSCSCK